MEARTLWRRICCVLLCVLFGLQLVRALTLELEYYDGYDNFHNAQAILGDSSAWFYRFRAPLPYIVLVPVMALQELGLFTDLLIGPHLFQWMLGVIAALLTIQCLKALGVSPLGSLFGTLSLFVSPLVAHYLPFAVPTTSVLLVLPLTILFVLELHKRPSFLWALFAGMVLGWATLARFQMAFFGPGIALFWLFNKPKEMSHGRSILILAVFGGAALLVWNGAFAVVQYLASDPRNPFAAGFQICLEYRERSGSFVSQFPASRTFYFEVFLKNYGVLGALFAIYAMVRVIRTRRSKDWLMLLCFLVFLAGQIFITNIEGRYSLVFSLFAVYFVARGLDLSLAKRGPSLVHAFLALGLISAFVPAFSELSKWTEPFYRRSFNEIMTDRVKRKKTELGEFSIYWRGPFHAEFAPQRPLHEYDPYQYVFHFGHKALIYHSPREQRDKIYAGARGMAQAMNLGRVLVIETHAPRPTNFSRPESSHPIRWIFVSEHDPENSERYQLTRGSTRLLLRGGEGERKVIWNKGQLVWPSNQDSVELPKGAEKVRVFEFQRGEWRP